jgi:hypothetical protein
MASVAGGTGKQLRRRPWATRHPGAPSGTGIAAFTNGLRHGESSRALRPLLSLACLRLESP